MELISTRHDSCLIFKSASISFEPRILKVALVERESRRDVLDSLLAVHHIPTIIRLCNQEEKVATSILLTLFQDRLAASYCLTQHQQASAHLEG